VNHWGLLAEVRRRIEKEEGTLRKQAPLKIALCCPSPYRVGMSSLGYQTIYREIHLHPHATAERAFLPERAEDYRRTRTGVFSYEGETPLGNFPILAFSVSYELEMPGFLEILDLCDIPVLREKRTEKHPLVIAGGPLTNSNPLLLAPFADAIILGEGEALIHAFLDAAASLRRAELLAFMARLPGCYVPGQSALVPPLAKAADELLPARSQILTGSTVLASMFLIEAERGCSRGCTYCVMRRELSGGMRPVRPGKILSMIPENARRVGLVGAAVTDHPEIKSLLRGILTTGRGVGISSLRADRLDEEMVQLLSNGGNRTLTTAADGASQRLRDLVGRKTTEQHLIRAARLARQFKMVRLKLYGMVGLPEETEADIDELIGLCGEMAAIIPLSLSVSPFVAKRRTPLEGAAFESIGSLEAKLARLRAGLKGRVEIRPASPKWAWVEYMLSQGDESAGLAALDAWRAGGSFSAWKRAFEGRGPKPLRQGAAPDCPRGPGRL
jgi:radical SAM superfamily enzyme YgiQ (UPF0313 family)